MLAAALALLATVALAAVALRDQSAGPAERALPPIRSLAVLPLANLSGEPDQDYLADGMTEELIGALVKLRELRVISRTSVMRYKGARGPLPEIARTLGVDGVIEGAVLRSGDRVRVTAQLIDARSDRLLWSERYDRELARVLEIQTEVARAVATAVELELSPRAIARMAPPTQLDRRAQEAYFRGMAHNMRSDSESMRRSIRAFEDVVAIAPDFAAGYAELASAHMRQWEYGEPEPGDLSAARRSARRAVEIDENLGDAHCVDARFYSADMDWASAEREYQRALDLGLRNPMNCSGYPLFLVIMGRVAEAFHFAEQLVARAPLDLQVRLLRARVVGFGGHPELAIEELNRVLAIEPATSRMVFFLRACNYQDLGRLDLSIREWRRYASLAPEQTDPAVPPWYGSLSQGRARALGFLGELEEGLRSNGRSGYYSALLRDSIDSSNAYGAAHAYTQLGRLGEAFASLEQFAREKSPLFFFVRTLRSFAPIHDDPRFEELARRMGLPPFEPKS